MSYRCSVRNVCVANAAKTRARWRGNGKMRPRTSPRRRTKQHLEPATKMRHASTHRSTTLARVPTTDTATRKHSLSVRARRHEARILLPRTGACAHQRAPTTQPSDIARLRGALRSAARLRQKIARYANPRSRRATRDSNPPLHRLVRLRVALRQRILPNAHSQFRGGSRRSNGRVQFCINSRSRTAHAGLLEAEL